jgi:hypothetical protein
VVLTNSPSSLFGDNELVEGDLPKAQAAPHLEQPEHP